MGDVQDEDEVLPELCDLCGTAVSNESEIYALVPDSSAIHAHDPKFDGKRMVVACSREHLAELVEQYKHRPFIDAELWAGKIYRAMEEHPDGISSEALAEETGLDQAQIELGVLWQNMGALRWHQQYGQGQDEGPEPG